MKRNLKADPILIIDDEPSVRKVLKLNLSRKGYNVDTAAGGEEGLLKMESGSYCLVLTDMKMPGISGEQVLEQIRNTDQKKIPVIGMSGTPWLLESIGFDAVLAKPYLMKDLLNLIHRFVDE